MSNQTYPKSSTQQVNIQHEDVQEKDT